MQYHCPNCGRIVGMPGYCITCRAAPSGSGGSGSGGISRKDKRLAKIMIVILLIFMVGVIFSGFFI